MTGIDDQLDEQAEQMRRGSVRRLLRTGLGRGVLGLVASARNTLHRRRLCGVRWHDGFWEYSWPEGRVFTYGFDPALTPAAWGCSNLDIFFHGYTPKRGDVVLDVGAGIGTEVFALARLVGPEGRVYAFEAHPRTFRFLSHLREVNAWRHVEVVNAAVLDQPGSIRISDVADPDSNTVFAGGDIEVPAVSLDDFVASHGLTRIDYLKMNIEGAEGVAIGGMEQMAAITSHCCISCHDFLGTEWGTTNQKVRAWLISHGFDVRDRPDDPRSGIRCYLYASKSI